MCMCVCVYVYIYVCIYLYIYIFYVYIYLCAEYSDFLCNLVEKCDFLTEKLGIKPDPDPKRFIPDPDPADPQHCPNV